jgi:uncharacterized membrane-anchored protein
MGMGYAFAAFITLLVAFPVLWALWWLVDAVVEAAGGHSRRTLRHAKSGRGPVY